MCIIQTPHIRLREHLGGRGDDDRKIEQARNQEIHSETVSSSTTTTTKKWRGIKELREEGGNLEGVWKSRSDEYNQSMLYEIPVELIKYYFKIIKFYYSSLFLSLFLCVYACGHTCAMVQLLREEDNLGDSVFHYVSPRDWIQGIRLSDWQVPLPTE